METIRVCSIQSFLPFSGRGLANKLYRQITEIYEVFLVEIKGFSQRYNDSLLVIYLHPCLFTFFEKKINRKLGKERHKVNIWFSPPFLLLLWYVQENCTYFQNYVDLINSCLQVRQLSDLIVKFHCQLFRLSFATSFQSHTKIRQNKLNFLA